MPDPAPVHRDDPSTGHRDEEGARLFVERIAMAFADLGFPRMAARVLFTVMSADDPLTAAEIGARLEVSPAAISGAVRYLTHVGMLVREPVPGSRRDRYRALGGGWYEATVMKQGVYKIFAELAEEGAEAVGKGTRGGQRLAEMRDFFNFVQGELSTLSERWRLLRGERDRG